MFSITPAFAYALQVKHFLKFDHSSSLSSQSPWVSHRRKRLAMQLKIQKGQLPSKLLGSVAATITAFSLFTSNVTLPLIDNLNIDKFPVYAEPTEVFTPVSDSPEETVGDYPIDPSSLPEEQQKVLKEQSKRNSRASGQVAQKFVAAKRAGEAGDLDSALDLYNEIIKLSPDFAPAYSNRGNIYVARKKFIAGKNDYDKCIRLAPLDNDSWVVYVNRGAVELELGDSTAALKDMNVAYNMKGGNEVVLSNRAGVYEILQKWDNAIRDYQGALKSNDIRPFWLRYGLVLFQRNKSFEALSILRRVAARYDVGDVHAAMAVIYFDRGDLPEAESEWSRVDRPRLFESRDFLVNERKWPPRAVEAMDNFRHLK